MELQERAVNLAAALKCLRSDYDASCADRDTLNARIAEQARELSLCRELRDAVQGIAVDAGVVITGDPIEDVRLAIEFRDTEIAEQAKENFDLEDRLIQVRTAREKAEAWVKVVEEALRVAVAQTEQWNKDVEAIIGRQPRTGIDLEAVDRALRAEKGGEE
jgi:hypothetical protein